MDEATRKKAIEKAQAFETFIGYPDQLLNVTLINQYYDKLNTEPDEYFKNVFSYNKFATDISYNKLREFSDKNE